MLQVVTICIFKSCFFRLYFISEHRIVTTGNRYNCSGLVGQCCDVALVGAHLAQENPTGSVFRNGEGMGREGNGEISL
jgi:hypothetical protein